MGLNITAWSYAGELYVAMLANADVIDNPAELMDLLPTALAEIVDTTTTLSGGPRAAA
jgi:hypothetical protein